MFDRLTKVAKALRWQTAAVDQKGENPSKRSEQQEITELGTEMNQIETRNNIKSP